MTFSCKCCDENDDGPRDLDVQNVNKVLNEVCPYLISDGITIVVKDVNASTWNGYLLLNWACNACASSTVTVMWEKVGTQLGR